MTYEYEPDNDWYECNIDNACSTLRNRSYWFEFDSEGNLIDTDCPEHDDGPAATAMADDCRDWLFGEISPEWESPR